VAGAIHSSRGVNGSGCPAVLKTGLHQNRRRPRSGRFQTVASSRSDNAVALIEWLISDECELLDDRGLIAGLGERLRAADVPVDRLTLHLRTLHPEIFARTVAWAPGEPVEVHDRMHGLQLLPILAGSPLQQVMEARRPISVRSGTARGDAWFDLDVFCGRGLAEFVIAPLLASVAPGNAVAFGTTRHGGFAPEERAVLLRILPALRVICEARSLRRVEATLLDTYIGVTTRERILAGHVRRGDVETLEAALLLCDLRDFTALSNRLPVGRVLELLNDYFDCVVPAIVNGGGEILKFMGDAVLAFFHRPSPGDACAAALEAGRAALEGLRGCAPPDAELRAGIALHYGAVSYGNIGSGTRLDFTLIGSDVNLVSRIQTACGRIGEPMLMSLRFAALLHSVKTRSVGRHELKGFSEPVELFAWHRLDRRNNTGANRSKPALRH
jgi:adenylate cyclase